jgi:ferredoxin-NADP reductase
VDEAGVLELQVIAMRRESDCVLSLELADTELRLLPEWQPGAHIDLWLPEHVRQYSLCGDPADRHRYRVAVLREPESSGGSAYVHETLRLGDLVEVGGPRNHFALADAEAYVFVAGGVGITPILPMVAEVERRGRPWRLAYGGRSRRSMAFLDALAHYGQAVHVRPEDTDGLLDLDDLLGRPAEQVAVYCCGPGGLIAAVEQRCAAWPAGALHVERFTARPRDDTDLRAFELVLARSGTRLDVPADASALDVLEAAGRFVPNACRDGVCGSCLTTVLGGTPEHRDSILDRDRTDVVLPCVSRAVGAELVIDL